MINEFVSTVFTVILSLVFFVVKLVLLPIDLLIAQLIPDISEAFTNIGTFLAMIAQGLGWAISASGIPYSVIALVAVYTIFKLTLPINVWLIKLALKWYGALKP